MKKLFFVQLFAIISVLALESAPLMAQSGGFFNIGVVGGENFANAPTVPSPSGVNANGTDGYVLGIRTDVSLVPMFSLQSELLVTERSFGVPAGSKIAWAESLTYLQIPILLKFSPIPGPIEPYAYLGPDFGLKLSASLDSGVAEGQNESSVFNSVDLDLDAGIGLQVQVLPILWIFAEGRYTYGLMNVYNNVQAGNNLGDLRARDFKWMAGAMIGL